MDPDGRKKVLIAGGGVAALEAALALRELAAELVNVELLAPETRFWYRPLAVAAPFQLGEVTHFELGNLAHELSATFTLGGLTGIDEWRHIAHTSTNRDIAYDMLLVACGALPLQAIPGAITFRGPADIELIEHLLEEIVGGDVRSVAFVIPWGSIWSLPAYELALLTGTYVRQRGLDGVELTLVTPEAEAVQLFGSPASDAVVRALDERGVTLCTGAYAGTFAEGELQLIPNGAVAADRVVALPRLQGAPIDGLPQTVHGFIPVDSHCRVVGVADVFAAGDITSFTVKQGGIAAQQADVAAAAIASAAGAPVRTRRFQPVLRGLLLTGNEPHYFRRELGMQAEQPPVASYEPLWWPPAKIVGHHLAPFLASLGGIDAGTASDEQSQDTVAVNIELGDDALETLTSRRLAFDIEAGPGGTVGEQISSEPLVVAPEDTLGEVAERVLKDGGGGAVVAEYGRIIGVLTTRDLVRAAASRVHPSQSRARQWMTAEPITVEATASLAAAARLMAEYGVQHLPVVEGERPVGMLRLDDTLAQVAVPAIGLGF